MLKLSPADTLARLTDKSRDVIREIDQTEAQLSANTKRLNRLRADIVDELHRVMCELDDIDKKRLCLMRDNLGLFSFCGEALFDRMSQSMNAVSAQIQALDLDSEINMLQKAIDVPPSSSEILKWKDTISVIPVECLDVFLKGGMIASDNTAAHPPIEAYVMVDRLVDSLDFFRGVTLRAMHTMIELADAEKTFKKSATRVVEKLGFTKSAIKSSGVSVGSCVDLIAQVESPTTRHAWESTFKAFGLISDVHSKAAEWYVEKGSQPLDALVRRFDNYKRDLIEKQVSDSKQIENLKSVISKLISKLSKVQKELHDRRVTVGKDKDKSRLDAAPSADVISSTLDINLERIGSFSGEKDYLADATSIEGSLAGRLSSLDNSEVAVSGGPNSAPTAMPAVGVPTTVAPTASSTSTSTISLSTSPLHKRSNNILQSFQTLKTAAYSIKEAVRETKLGEAVGMETTAERFQRIENRIITLEQEERAYLETLLTTIDSVKIVYETTVSSFKDGYEAMRGALVSELAQAKTIFESLLSCNINAIDQSRAALQAVKEAHGAIHLVSSHCLASTSEYCILRTILMKY